MRQPPAIRSDICQGRERRMLQLWKRLKAAPTVRPKLPRRRRSFTAKEVSDRFRRNDTDGAARRSRQTVEDNRLL
jgi:hypothetical protein